MQVADEMVGCGGSPRLTITTPRTSSRSENLRGNDLSSRGGRVRVDGMSRSADSRFERDSIEIRAFQPGDLAGVMALAPRLTEWVAAWRDPAAVLAAVRGWVSGSATQANQDDHAFFVAVADRQIVGLVTVSEQEHFSGQVDAYVSELAVAQAWEGRGIGGGLMRAAESWAAGRELSFISLHTGAANTPARGLYTSLGFALEDVRLTKPVRQVRRPSGSSSGSSSGGQSW
jgi:ribosomal protein S18 acetylase RimI-like enzyme